MNKIISYIRDHTYLTYIYVIAVAVFEAFFSVIFIYPNEFAPAGMPGITVMLQKLTGVSAAIFFFLVNVPLFIAAWWVLHRRYTLITVCYVVSFSVVAVMIQEFIKRFELTHIQVHLDAWYWLVILAVAEGLMYATVFSATTFVGGGDGGTNLLGGIINQYQPKMKTQWISFAIKAVTAVASYFVYERSFLSVALSLICGFACGYAASVMLKWRKRYTDTEVNENFMEQTKEFYRGIT